MRLERSAVLLWEARKRLVAASIVATAILLATACAELPWRKPGPSPHEKLLVSGQWHLVQLNHRAVTAGDTARGAWLRFDGVTHRVEGSGGCNRLSGTYSVVDDEYMHFGAMTSTMMACADPTVNAQEQEFRTALAHVDRFDIYRDRLELTVGADMVAALAR